MQFEKEEKLKFKLDKDPGCEGLIVVWVDKDGHAYEAGVRAGSTMSHRLRMPRAGRKKSKMAA